MTKFVNPKRFEILKENVTQVFSLIFIVLLWTLMSLTAGRDIFPTPIAVLPEIVRLIASGDFLVPLVSTFVRVIIGFLLGMTLGSTIGILASQNKDVEILSFLWLPIIMSMPTLVLIFIGFMVMGLGSFPVVIICGIVVLPTFAVNLRDCLRSVDVDLVEMADSYRVTTAAKVRHIFIPHLIPALLAASKIGFSLAWKVAVLSEVFGLPNGIGFKIRIRYMQYNIKSLLAYLIMFLLVVIIIEQFLRVIERKTTRWKKR